MCVMSQRIRTFPGIEQFRDLASYSAVVLYQVLRVSQQ